MNDQDSVNVGTKHSSGARLESPVSPDQGLAGRELDAIIDERIFLCGEELPPDVGMSRIMWERGEPFRTSAAADPSRWQVPHYSTDIAAAMEVVEKLTRERPYDVEMLYLFDFQGWCVEITLAAGDNGSVAKAESLPEAICRAALATVNAPAQEMETQ